MKVGTVKSNEQKYYLSSINPEDLIRNIFK